MDIKYYEPFSFILSSPISDRPLLPPENMNTDEHGEAASIHEIARSIDNHEEEYQHEHNNSNHRSNAQLVLRLHWFRLDTWEQTFINFQTD